jgi:polyisoprenoid-binding protein YceI
MITTSLPHSLRLAVALSATALMASAGSASFDFQDPKGVNHVQFSLDAPLESIAGTGSGVTGTVEFDPSAPASTSGRIVLDASSLTVGNPVMADHLRGAQWLDVANHPTIIFEAVRLANVRAQGTQTVADVAGRLTVKGVTRDIVAPVSFTYLPDKLGARLGNEKVKGDLLVMRTNFAINRSDFNLMPGQMSDKVAETIHLSLSIAGAAPQR